MFYLSLMHPKKDEEVHMKSMDFGMLSDFAMDEVAAGNYSHYVISNAPLDFVEYKPESDLSESDAEYNLLVSKQ